MSRPDATTRLRRAAPALMLAAVTVTAFIPVASAGFLSYDDPQYVSGNATVLQGLTARGVRWALTSFLAANWHPLTWISHMLDVSLFGANPAPHHLVNLALHAASAVLLLFLLRGMTGASWPGFVAAALFALHPQRAESVAWISERKDVLSVFLGTLTLLAYLRYVRRPGVGRYLAVAAAMALGLAAKPMLVTLPFVLLLLDWWPLGRFGEAPGTPTRGAPGLGRLLLEKAPLFGIAAASSVVTYLAQLHAGAVIAAGLFPPAARIWNAVASYAHYLGAFFRPIDLIPFYRHRGLAPPDFELAISVLLLTALTALAVVSRRRHPWLLTGWLWFLGVLVPVLGLVQVGLQGMADRYSYLPSVGLSVAVVWEAASRAPRARAHRGLRSPLTVPAVLALAALAALTWRQTSYWKDTQTLFTRVVTVDSKNFSGFNLLGADYLTRNEPAKALPFLRRSIEIWPAYQDGLYNLGVALARLGETGGAITQFEAILRINPRDAEVLFHLGQALARQGRLPEALRRFDAALALSPDEPAVVFARGLVHAKLEQLPEAAADFRRVLELDPACAEARENLELALRLMRGESAPPSPAPEAGSPRAEAAGRSGRR